MFESVLKVCRVFNLPKSQFGPIAFAELLRISLLQKKYVLNYGAMVGRGRFAMIQHYLVLILKGQQMWAIQIAVPLKHIFAICCMPKPDLVQIDPGALPLTRFSYSKVFYLTRAFFNTQFSHFLLNHSSFNTVFPITQ